MTVRAAPFWAMFAPLAAPSLGSELQVCMCVCVYVAHHACALTHHTSSTRTYRSAGGVAAGKTAAPSSLPKQASLTPWRRVPCNACAPPAPAAHAGDVSVPQLLAIECRGGARSAC